jgi:hypothetical protein
MVQKGKVAGAKLLSVYLAYIFSGEYRSIKGSNTQLILTIASVMTNSKYDMIINGSGLLKISKSSEKRIVQMGSSQFARTGDRFGNNMAVVVGAEPGPQKVISLDKESQAHKPICITQYDGIAISR